MKVGEVYYPTGELYFVGRYDETALDSDGMPYKIEFTGWVIHLSNFNGSDLSQHSSKNKCRCFSKKSKYFLTFSSSVHLLVSTG